MDFSLIIPCYNEEEGIPRLFEETTACFDAADISCELVFVNDGSTDGTSSAIRREIERYRARGEGRMSFVLVDLSRNFGKESAMYAGLDRSCGDYAGFMDADLQQDPKVALSMLELLMGDETCDCVAAVQELRHENPLLRGCKELFYRLFNRMSDTRIEADVSDFRVFTRQVADALLSMGETFRFSRGLFGWIGFRTRVVPYQVRDRCSGSSKWSFKSLMSYAWNGILAFSTWPLKVIMALGVVLALFSLVLLGVDVFDKLVLNDELSLTMVLIYVVLLLGGLQMFVLGVLGEYVARGYVEAKRRPIYLTRDVVVDRIEAHAGHDANASDAGAASPRSVVLAPRECPVGQRDRLTCGKCRFQNGCQEPSGRRSDAA